MSTINPAFARIGAAGFIAVIDGDTPAMICPVVDGDTYAAPDWDSLAFYAQNYALCECGSH